MVCATASLAMAKPSASYNSGLIADFQVGIFCKPSESHDDAEGSTIKGTVQRFDNQPRLARRTQVIPAVDGIMFGVEARESPDSAANVTITVEHPPLGAKGLTHESWETRMSGTHTTFHGYYLGLSDGNPKGRWVITATRGKKTLFRAEFDVSGPAKPSKDPCRVATIG